MPSALYTTQIAFAKTLAKFLTFLVESGYDFKLGEAGRSDEQAIINALGFAGRMDLVGYLEKDPRWHGLALAIANNGKANGILLSLHRESLAVDISLFKDGVYLTSSDDYAFAGRQWEALHSLARWGGKFGDGNHFSFEWQGRK